MRTGYVSTVVCAHFSIRFVFASRGVFQTLVEKHFPAPDRKKTSDWFTSSLWDDSPVPSPSGGTKRKKTGEFRSLSLWVRRWEIHPPEALLSSCVEKGNLMGVNILGRS